MLDQFSSESVLNAVEFILEHPTALGDLKIRRYIDAVLFRPPFMSEIVKQQPLLVEKWLDYLDKKVETALKQGESSIAYYLMHVASSVESFRAGSQEKYTLCHGYFAGKNQKYLLEAGQKNPAAALYLMEAFKLGQKAHMPLQEKVVKWAYMLVKGSAPDMEIAALHHSVCSWVERYFPQCVSGGVQMQQQMSLGGILPPKVMMEHEIYRLFGGRKLQGQITKIEENKIYYETSVEGRRFRLIYIGKKEGEKEIGELFISQEFIDPNSKESRWFTYVPPPASDGRTPPNLIQNCGAWVQDDGALAHVIIGDQIGWQQANVLVGAISPQGIVESLFFYGTDRRLGLDPKGDKIALISCVSPERVLISGPKSGAVDQIDLFGMGISLRKVNGRWIHQNYVWGDPVKQEGYNEETRALLAGLGKTAQDVTLVMYNENDPQENKIYLMPYAVRSAKPVPNSTSIDFEFNKPKLQESDTKPIEVIIRDGQIKTSCAGFLYLAQIAAHQKNMKRALFYLEQAKRAPFSIEDTELFEWVQSLTAQLPEDHPRQVAFKLKAMLLVNFVRRAHLKGHGWQPGLDKTYEKRVQREKLLFDGYKKGLEEYKKKNFSRIVLQEIELTSEELYELDLDFVVLKGNNTEQVREHRLIALQESIQNRKKNPFKPSLDKVQEVWDIPQSEKITTLLSKFKQVKQPLSVQFNDSLKVAIGNDDELKDLKQTENIRLEKEFEKSRKLFEAELKNRVSLTSHDAEIIEKDLRQNRLVDLDKKVNISKKQIFRLLRENKKKLSPEVRRLLRMRSELSKEAFIDQLLNLYQKDSGTGVPALNQEISSFLFYGIERKILSTICRDLAKARKLPDEKQRINEYTRIKLLMEAVVNYERYKDQAPERTRKYLVTEYRKGIVLRNDQITMIDEVVKDPTLLKQLSPGKGKTSTILPIALHLLAEGGKLPFGVVPRELFVMNREQMNRTTSEIFQGAAYVVQFSHQMLSDNVLLTQELDRLYEAKQNKGYVLTTREDLASLSHAMTACDEELEELHNQKKKLMEEKANNEQLEALENAQKMLEARRETLKEVCILFASKEAPYFLDEVDDTASVEREVNLGSIQKQDLSETVCSAGLKFIKELMKGSLKEAILSGQHASLSEQQIANVLDQFKVSDTGNLGAAQKRILREFITPMLGEEVELDFGLHDNGFEVIPLSQKENQGTKFRDQYQIVLHCVLFYVQRGPSKDFLANLLRAMRMDKPNRFAELLKRAAQHQEIPVEKQLDTIMNYILEKKNWEERLEILQKDVFEKSFIKVSAFQYFLNVQNIFRDKVWGGTSGTLETKALRGLDSSDKQEEDVEAETYIKLAAGLEGGFNAPVSCVKDGQELEGLVQKLNHDKEVGMVMSIGVSLSGKSSKEIAEHLAERTKKRVVFVDPKDRKSYICTVSKKETTIVPFPSDGWVPEDAIVFYDPSDKRGLDFKIRPCKAIFLPGPTTTKDHLCQGLWRARDLGFGHTAEPLINYSFAGRITGKPFDEKSKPPTVGQMISCIREKTLAAKARKNLKVQLVEIEGIVSVGLRAIERSLDKSCPEFFKLIKEFFVKESTVDFSEKSLEKQDTIEFLQGVCKRFKGKLETIAEKLPKDMSNKKEVFEKLQELKNQLNKKSEDYSTRKKEYKAILPQKVAKSFSDDIGTHSVQIEVEQQIIVEQGAGEQDIVSIDVTLSQQQQVSKITQKPPEGKLYRGQYLAHISAFFELGESFGFPKISPNMRQLIDSTGGTLNRGECKVLILRQGEKSAFHFITTTDAMALHRQNGAPGGLLEKNKVQATIYSMTEDGLELYENLSGEEPSEFSEPSDRLRVSIWRILVGYKLSEKEIEAAKEDFKEVCKKGKNRGFQRKDLLLWIYDQCQDFYHDRFVPREKREYFNSYLQNQGIIEKQERIFTY